MYTGITASHRIIKCISKALNSGDRKTIIEYAPALVLFI